MESELRPHVRTRTALKRGAARLLRNNATEAERKLWHVLRDKRLHGLKFRRQQPIGPYVTDFYCSAAKPIIELDGGQHANGRTPSCDSRRTKWLELRGYTVLRFWNSDVLKDSDYVIGRILDEVEKIQGAKLNDPSPKFAPRCFANFDPPSRGGLVSPRRNVRDLS